MCNKSRWVKQTAKGKKIQHKVLRYFPLKDRLEQLYASRHTAKDMTWHHRGRSTEERVMQHPVDGKAWKDFDVKYLEFANEPQNVDWA